MKHFKLMKGIFTCLLSLALVVMCFATVSAKAGDKTITITLKVNGGTGADKTENATISDGSESVEYTLPSYPDDWKAPEGKVFDGWAESADGDKISVSKKELTESISLYAKYKDAPKVTFTINVECGDDDVKGAYTYVSELSVKDDATTLADVLAAATKKVENKDVNLTDPSAWILNTSAGKTNVAELTDEFVKFTAADGSFKVLKNLEANKTITICVAPAKLNISFVVDGYKSTFTVENGAKAKSKISYADIAAGLKKTVSEGNEAQEVALEGKVVTKVGEAAQTGKYSASAYEVANDVIGTTDFTDVTITVADAFTENSGYDPATDSIFFESPVEVTVYWVDVKKAAGATLTSKNFKSLDLKKEKDAETYTGSISLNDKSAGLKIAENKATYLYASIVEPAAAKTKYTANYVVDATPYKKIAVTLAYAQADKDAEGPAIATITTTDNKKKTVVYSGKYDAQTKPENYLYGVADVAEDADVYKNLEYSTDGTTWYNVNALPETVNGKEVKRALDLGKVYELVNSGSKSTLYFRISGGKAVAAVEADSEAIEAKNAYRATKALKFAVGVAKDTKAVKVSVSTGTIALKNGYDYFVTDSKTEEPTAADAITILPFNKDGKATTTVNGEEVATTTIGTSDYTPVKKAKENDKMFTSTKVKGVLIEDIVKDTSKDMYIWIRKSATANKPADKWVCISLAKVTEAPVITEVKGQKYYSLQDVADTKGTVAAPEVKNASSDKNSGAYEYLIVDAADIAEGLKVDLSTAKWNTLGEKGVTVGKDKSKYANAAGQKATAHVLKDGSVILIRRAGDKSSNILASQYIATTIVKQDVEVEVEKDGKKVKETKSLYVWKAYATTQEG